MKSIQKLHKKWNQAQLVVVGLDSDSTKLPTRLIEKNGGNKVAAILEFNKSIIDSTHKEAAGFKINIAFYESHGSAGIAVFEKTIEYITQNYPESLIIADVKRGDIGNTNNGYTRYLEMCDAITINGFFGTDANLPFFNEKFKDKLVIVLAKTSNEGSLELQNKIVDGVPVYLKMTQMAKSWGKNYAVVVGATHPTEMMIVREEIGESGIILAPGIGKQGGDLKETIQSGTNQIGHGLLINASRSIIFASDSDNFAKAAQIELRKMNAEIKEYLELPKKSWAVEKIALQAKRTLEILREQGAIITDGHFVYSSGKHGSTYINKDKVSVNPLALEEIGMMMADRLKGKGIQTVVVPALGAIALGQIVAKYLSYYDKTIVNSIFLEKTKGENGEETFEATRGYEKYLTGKCTGIEDILTTGKSLAKVIESGQKYGAEFVAGIAICNRGGVTSENIGGVPLISLANVEMTMHEESDCPLCEEGIPINTELGHGKKFMEKQKHQTA